MSLRHFRNDELVPVSPIITYVTLIFTLHMSCVSVIIVTIIIVVIIIIINNNNNNNNNNNIMVSGC
jgi:ABC-type protease/lipase transport system fused ATPase/permease subunit